MLAGGRCSAVVTRVGGDDIAIGAQDCHSHGSGAHTGCISVGMAKEAGAKLVIVGHSERRAEQHETDAEVRAKAETALRHGLQAIVCVGETKEQRRHDGTAHWALLAIAQSSLKYAFGQSVDDGFAAANFSSGRIWAARLLSSIHFGLGRKA